ncbi:MAG: GHKL domain-containing protein [Deltaproteobacteria bacterium]|nr:GHKL domain-containing protein [Deltaproteobacteria bacterium]
MNEVIVKKILMESSHGIVILDQDKKICLWNRWMETHSHLSEGEVLGQSILSVFPEITSNIRLNMGLKWCLESGKYSLISERYCISPLPLKSDTGKIINSRIVMTPIPFQGSFHCSMEIYDSSSLLAKEQYAVEQNKKLKSTQAALVETSKLAALGEMAGGIAHEINTPLGSILLRASQIKRILEKDQTNTAKVIEFSDMIVDICNRISSIVTGLRSFARVGENDPFVIKNISEIVGDTLSLCTTRLENNGVLLNCPLQDDFDIECRPVQISQVLLNMISNAQHAIENLEDKWITITYKKSGDMMQLSVTDSGKGIAPHIRDKIMQPFFTTKDIGEGTGLGLSISSGIIQDHGGSIMINSESEHTMFMIEMPVRRLVADRDKG